MVEKFNPHSILENAKKAQQALLAEEQKKKVALQVAKTRQLKEKSDSSRQNFAEMKKLNEKIKQAEKALELLLKEVVELREKKVAISPELFKAEAELNKGLGILKGEFGKKKQKKDKDFQDQELVYFDQLEAELEDKERSFIRKKETVRKETANRESKIYFQQESVKQGELQLKESLKKAERQFSENQDKWMELEKKMKEKDEFLQTINKEWQLNIPKIRRILNEIGLPTIEEILKTKKGERKTVKSLHIYEILRNGGNSNLAFGYTTSLLLEDVSNIRSVVKSKGFFQSAKKNKLYEVSEILIDSHSPAIRAEEIKREYEDLKEKRDSFIKMNKRIRKEIEDQATDLGLVNSFEVNEFLSRTR